MPSSPRARPVPSRPEPTSQAHPTPPDPLSTSERLENSLTSERCRRAREARPRASGAATEWRLKCFSCKRPWCEFGVLKDTRCPFCDSPDIAWWRA
jgi:hypothetical protein